MDISNSKLLEADEDESMRSGDNVDASNRDIEGKNHSPSQQFATLNNGIGDANTNIHRQHILESTQMKEQQPSVLGNLNQEVKRENIHLEPGQLWENPCHVPQASNSQSRNYPTGNESERLQPQFLKLQKMSRQQAHGLKEMKILELLNFLVPQVDKDRAVQLGTLYRQLKNTKFSVDAACRCIAGVVGDKMLSLAMSKLNQLQKMRRMATNQNVRSTCVGGQSTSTINITIVPNFERQTSVNGPSRIQGGPISHFQNNSSLPLNFVRSKGSVTNDQKMGPSSSVIHQQSVDQSFDLPHKPPSLVQQDASDTSVKQNNANPSRSNDELEKQSSKMVLSTSTTHASIGSTSMTTQLDSSTMVNSPGLFGTFPAEANVRKTPKMPCVGQKKPLETLGSSLPPSSKRQKVCGTNVKKLNDVTALSGVNIKKETKELLSTRPKKDRHVSEASRRLVQEEEERSILQKIPLQRKLEEIMAKSGLKHINDDVERCLSLCVEERMRGLLSNIIRFSKQRVDAEKCRNRIFITSDIRKQINEMNQKVKDEWDKKQAEEKKLKNVEENDTEKEENPSKQVKPNKEEEDKRRTKAANVAARAALGGNDSFLKWQLMAEARKKASSGPGSNSKKPYVEIGGMNQGLQKVVRSISAKDVIAVLETEPQMSKSTLLYRLYNRICSDVPTKEKT